MLDKLRRKMVLVSMALVTAALALMAATIFFVQYQQLKGDVIGAVEYAVSDTAFQPRDAVPPALREGDLGPAGRQGMPRRIEASDMVATSTYLLDSTDVLSQTLIDALELDSDTRDAALAAALERYDELGSSPQSGHLEGMGLYFAIGQTPSGLKVSFASEGYIANSLANLALVLGLVSLGAWIVFLIASMLLARWMVQPTQRAWEQQQRFVADASHELKTPLAVMMANNSILLSHKEQTVESQLRWVESNQAEARQMLELVNDMLFLARPADAHGQQKLAEDMDFSSLVQANALQFEAIAFERGIQLEDDIAPDVHVKGDAQRLQRLVATLVDNACKYADSHVGIRLSREGGQALLRVQNDGALIPAEDLEHVFERFYRVDKARVRSEGGVGLGLAIAREVAREHQGDIRVASSEEAGTVFTVSLPCA